MIDYGRRQLAANPWLEGFRKDWERGDSTSLFCALQCCGLLKVPIPDWCTEALGAGVSKLTAFEASSLDDAFGRPFPKGARLDAQRRLFDLSPVVYGLCKVLIDEGVSIGPELFEHVSYILKETGRGDIEKTTVEKYYYFQKKFSDALTQTLRGEGIGPA